MANHSNFSVIGYAVILLVVLITGECFSYFALRYVVVPRDGAAFYREPSVNEIDYGRYVRERDPVLGWPSPAQFGTKSFDSTGARPSPAFPEPGNECVALYGNSFTYGDDVGDAEAWGNLLSSMLGCRVANFGVPGYGTDQALLRFIGRQNDTSELVILGIFPDNIMRNVNQNRYFLTGGEVLSLKPRYVLDTNALRLIEIPNLTFEEFVRSFDRPSEVYGHESFLVGSAYGPIRSSFPYTYSLSKYLLSERVRNGLMGRPSWIGYLEETHPSGALQITAKITETFRDEAKERGKDTLVLFFPTPASMKYFQNYGRSALQPLARILGEAGIEVFDLHQPLLEKLGERSICSVLVDSESCQGHFNPEGNRLVAESVITRVSRVR